MQCGYLSTSSRGPVQHIEFMPYCTDRQEQMGGGGRSPTCPTAEKMLSYRCNRSLLNRALFISGLRPRRPDLPASNSDEGLFFKGTSIVNLPLSYTCTRTLTPR